jgi:tRNA pseudouridine38-40 synthase
MAPTEIGQVAVDNPSSPRRRITVAYDGGAYSGWQLQADAPTVQGRLEQALQQLLQSPVRVTGSGRTDAGVHALGQVAHFDDPSGTPLERLQGGINGLLPPDIRVRELRPVDPEFHAIYSARDKTYVYQFHLPGPGGGPRQRGAALSPMRRRTFHVVRSPLDVEAMRAAAAHLIGRHDFLTFSKAMAEGRPTVRRLDALRVLHVPHGLRIVATGEGFLYGMVRLLSGLLLDVGRGRVGPEQVPELLTALDRSLASPSLPAHGLILWRVRYGEPVDL